jgi:hypothetical protein
VTFDVKILYLLITLVVFFVIQFFISSIRNYSLYRLFDYKIRFKDILKACLSAQIGNLFSIPLLGMMYGYRYKLKKNNVPNSVIAITVIYDKLFVAAVGVIMSIYFISSFDYVKFIKFDALNKQLFLEPLIFLSSVLILLLIKKRKIFFEKYYLLLKKMLFSFDALMLITSAIFGWLISGFVLFFYLLLKIHIIF